MNDPKEIEYLNEVQKTVHDYDWKNALELIYGKLSLHPFFKDGRYSPLKKRIADLWQTSDMEVEEWPEDESQELKNILEDFRILASQKRYLDDLYAKVMKLLKQGFLVSAFFELCVSLEDEISSPTVFHAKALPVLRFVVQFSGSFLNDIQTKKVETDEKKFSTIINSLFVYLRNPDAFNEGGIEDLEILNKGLLQLMAIKTTIPVAIDYTTAFVVASQLQLAYRHPANQQRNSDSDPSLIAFDFARQLQSRIREVNPQLSQILDAGWHPECDKSPLN